ncbi:MAG: stage II sporulation protein D [Clostridia bacterium]|nr:stage II sporulation protein D [Clostridia bacterium]
MKGYLLVFLSVALLLLLLPLPALPRGESAAESTPDHSVSEPLPNHDPQTDEPSDSAVFKVRCGQQTVTLTEREFLLRSLAMEMSPTYHVEALKAQTVATYTYYCRRREAQRAQPKEELADADFVSPNEKFPAAYTTEKLKEAWGDNYTVYYNKLCEAVDAVAGKTMQQDGKYIDACYFAISNGCTESAETVWGADIPYLQAVASPGDRLAAGYESTATFTAEEMKAALSAEPAVSLSNNPADWFGAPTLSAAGTVDTIPVGNTTLTGVKVRQLLGLRSATFTVVFADGKFTFTVQGYGHGVGMSQYGADYLARQGYTWEKILQYYYTDVTIS